MEGRLFPQQILVQTDRQTGVVCLAGLLTCTNSEICCGVSKFILHLADRIDGAHFKMASCCGYASYLMHAYSVSPSYLTL